MTRRSAHRGTTDSYLVSVSDLMAGLLFFFIIALAAMLSAQHESKRQVDIERRRWLHVQEDRDRLLESLQEALRKEGIDVTIDRDGSRLAMPSAVLFEKNDFHLSPAARERAATLRRVLLRFVPCWTPAWNDFPSCKEDGLEDPQSFIDTLLIEGHTDADPVEWDPVRGNWKLSSQRAISLYLALAEPEPGFPRSLDELVNKQGQKILAVSGYAATRPACTDTPASEKCKARNRRIDLRFILRPGGMYDHDKAAKTP